MVGISLLTLVPGEVGGSETYARGLCRGLAEVGTLEYTVFTPPAAPGAGEGLREVPVPEYRVARSMRERALAMALAGARPGRIRRRLEDVDVLHYALTVAVPKVDAPSVVTLFDLQHLDLPELFSRASAPTAASPTRAGTQCRRSRRQQPVRAPDRDRTARRPARAHPYDPARHRPRPLHAGPRGA